MVFSVGTVLHEVAYMESFIGRSFDVIALKERRKKRWIIVTAVILCAAILCVSGAGVYFWYINREFRNYEVID